MKNWTIIFLTILVLYSCGQTNVQNQDITAIIDGEDTTLSQMEVYTNKNKDSIVERWFDPMSLDTLFNLSNTIQLTLKHTDSVLIDEYFLDGKILDSIRKAYDNSHLEALAVEKYLLKTNSHLAKRDTNGLSVKLSNGDWKLLTNDPMTDEADHTFEYFFRQFGYYSIRVQWCEGNGYKLVNFSNGIVTKLFGRPYFSPNGQYVLTVITDLEAGYSQNGFQLFRNKGGRLQHLGNYQPTNWGPVSAKWIDNNNLILKNETIEFKNGTTRYIEFYSALHIEDEN